LQIAHIAVPLLATDRLTGFYEGCRATQDLSICIEAKKQGASFLFGPVEEALVNLLLGSLPEHAVERRRNGQDKAERQPGATFVQQKLREMAPTLHVAERACPRFFHF